MSTVSPHCAPKSLKHPEPAFEIGEVVQTVGDQHTFKTGLIRDRIWHHKDAEWKFYLSVDGKKVSKRYQTKDLQKADPNSDLR